MFPLPGKLAEPSFLGRLLALEELPVRSGVRGHPLGVLHQTLQELSRFGQQVLARYPELLVNPCIHVVISSKREVAFENHPMNVLFRPSGRNAQPTGRLKTGRGFWGDLLTKLGCSLTIVSQKRTIRPFCVEVLEICRCPGPWYLW